MWATCATLLMSDLYHYCIDPLAWKRGYEQGGDFADNPWVMNNPVLLADVEVFFISSRSLLNSSAGGLAMLPVL